MGKLMGLAMIILAAALFGLPHVEKDWHVTLYAVAMGIAGGIVTVLFFAVWARAFGRAHLGKIQGVAQMMTVLASAVGPLMLAECQRRTGSYTLMFMALAPMVAALGAAAWLVPMPTPEISAGPKPSLAPASSSTGASDDAPIATGIGREVPPLLERA
jgi:MFS family permease